MNKEKFSSISGSPDITHYILQVGICPEEILELRAPTWQDTHMETKDRLQRCQLPCCFLLRSQDNEIRKSNLIAMKCGSLLIKQSWWA